MKDVVSEAYKKNCSLNQILHQIRDRVRKSKMGEWYCVESQDTTAYDIFFVSMPNARQNQVYSDDLSNQNNMDTYDDEPNNKDEEQKWWAMENYEDANDSKEQDELPSWWIPTYTSLSGSDGYNVPVDIENHDLAKQAVKEFYSTTSRADYQVLKVFVVQNLHTWYQHQNLENTWLTTKRITPATKNIRWMWHG
ncbi:hypothetical protein RFI_12164 [Reticulomyxa filosa]|uniref:Uncharacterized protein n=1 Tax=Reticulomyxa filosa TaxID=46433 RepID=X6NI08_RETFI|nr:hypothetical protein RFI_12164 [Reticulomyxa filosa]|eukprot:ETO24977.1 hypothetical protein RFI_12164 [Reticulomyxa filosa]